MEERDANILKKKIRDRFSGRNVEVLRQREEEKEGITMMKTIITMEMDLANLGKTTEKECAAFIAEDARAQGYDYPAEVLAQQTGSGLRVSAADLQALDPGTKSKPRVKDEVDVDMKSEGDSGCEPSSASPGASKTRAGSRPLAESKDNMPEWAFR